MEVARRMTQAVEPLRAEETTTPQEVTDSTATTSQAQAAAAIITAAVKIAAVAAMTEAETTAEGVLLQAAGEIVPVADQTAADSRAAINRPPPTPEVVGPIVAAIPLKGTIEAVMAAAMEASVVRIPVTEAAASVLDRDDSNN